MLNKASQWGCVLYIFFVQIEALEDQGNAAIPDEYLAELHLSLAKVYNEVSQRTDFQQEATRMVSPPDLDVLTLRSVRTQADTTAALNSCPSVQCEEASRCSAIVGLYYLANLLAVMIGQQAIDQHCS